MVVGGWKVEKKRKVRENGGGVIEVLPFARKTHKNNLDSRERKIVWKKWCMGDEWGRIFLGKKNKS